MLSIKDRIRKIKAKIDTLPENKIIEIESMLFANNRLFDKLADWPKAADEMAICSNSESDKKARAMAVFNLFVAERIRDKKSSRMLDYGCGEGHLCKVAAEEIGEVVGFDIVQSSSSDKKNLTFVSKRENIKGKFDFILMYDVLDHVVDREPQEVLAHAKSLLAENGMIAIRFHPWSSRHGTHLWSLNKLHAHLVFTDEELEQLGHINMPTYKVTKPRITYKKWIDDCGLKIIWENTVYEQTGPFFERNPDIKKIITSRIDNFGYHDIEETFKDFVVKVK